MFKFPHSLSRSLLIAGAFTGMALAATLSQAQNDPPPAARVTHIQANVSIQPNGTQDWGQAENNMPVGPGDRVVSDQQGEGELQAAQVRAYFSPNADLTLVNLGDQGVELGLAAGSANIFSDGFGPGGSLYVSTPNGGVAVSGYTNFRLDIYPDQQAIVISNVKGTNIQISGAGGFAMQLGQGQAVQLTGTNPVYSQPMEILPSEGFDRWSAALESHRFNSPSARYVSVEMAGYDELDGNGDWQPESDYGPIWFPHVQAGWAPYHFGHWVNRPFFGWTWVADESWGAAPFHYGRWVVLNGRWGWIPGPREGHPIWSPAQVVFAGGIQFGGAGVAVWFPLGPGEPFNPWYPCSPTYINQINITNIRPSRLVQVQNTYVNIVNVTNVTYVNRTVGVTAMNQSDFASGRPAQAAPVKIDVKQLEHVQPAKPQAKPPAQPVVLHPVAKPVAVPAARPVLINHTGQAVSAAPNAKPVAVPVKANPPAPKPIPGAKPIGNPSIGGKPAPPAAAPKSEPAAAAPAEKNAPAKPANQPPAKVAPPAAKPAAPESKPEAKPAETKPGTPPAKTDNKTDNKNDKKKDNKKPGDKKPEDKKPE
jgi:hypothetical protein